MPNPPTLLPTQLDISAENALAMVRFYNDFFAAELAPFEAHGTTLYRGKLHGIDLLICPNELAGVEAARNRHQFNYATPDLAAALTAAKRAGGQVRDETPTSATVLDPDGNTIVILQASVRP